MKIQCEAKCTDVESKRIQSEDATKLGGGRTAELRVERGRWSGLQRE